MIKSTSSKNNCPNFFVIGAPKCGTTSIYHYLMHHDQVFVPKIKEQHYFSLPEVKDTYYDIITPNNYLEYLNNYKDSENKKILADISPSYLYNQKSANRIKRVQPDAKILAILRDPVDRSISHYLMDLRIGYANKTFMSYLDEVDSNHYKEYIGNSFYFEKIKYFKEVFKENLLVLSYSELVIDPKLVMNSIFKFLDIDILDLDYHEKYNTYAHPNTSLLFYLRKAGVYNLLSGLIPYKMKCLIRSCLENSSIPKPDFSEEKVILRDIFMDDSLKLENFLGRKMW